MENGGREDASQASKTGHMIILANHPGPTSAGHPITTVAHKSFCLGPFLPARMLQSWLQYCFFLGGKDLASTSLQLRVIDQGP